MADTSHGNHRMTFQRDRLPDPQTGVERHGITVLRYGKRLRMACPSHGGHNPNFSMHRETGAFLCFVCGVKGGDIVAFEMLVTGCDFVTACKALGAWDHNKPDPNAIKRKPLPFNARDALDILATETNLVAIAAANVANGVKLTPDDLMRVLKAAGRIKVMQEACA